MSNNKLLRLARQIHRILTMAPGRRNLRNNRLVVEHLEQRWLPAAIMVAADPGLFTTESGDTAQFTVVLSEQPTKKVHFTVKTDDKSEGVAGVRKLTFDSSNWNQPQTVTVKGVDDSTIDGDQSYSIVLGVARGDKLYRKQNPADVALTNRDNDSAGIQVVAGNSLQTTEAGGTATFTIRLTSKPTSNVVIPIQSSNTQEGTVASSVTFTPANWDKAQTVTITGVDDSAIDHDQEYQISLGAAVSTDSRYSGLTTSASPLSVTNHDNDVAGLQVSPTTTMSILEGGSKDVSVKLTAKPTSDVTVNIAVTTGAGQATLSTTTLTFTPANWNVSQKVTINALLGDGIDGDKQFAITLSTSSEDLNYVGLTPTTVNATIVDTDGQSHTLDGNYTGSYEGTVTAFGIPTSQSGDVAFSVVGNLVTVTQPADASGTITDGSGTFAPTSGPLVGGSFTGTFTENPDGTVTVAGTWTYSHGAANGQGTWTATRPAPAPA